MFQVVFKGSFEVEDADKFVEEVDKLLKSMSGTQVGTTQIYQLAPYIDYQICNAEDTQSDNTDISTTS